MSKSYNITKQNGRQTVTEVTQKNNDLKRLVTCLAIAGVVCGLIYGYIMGQEYIKHVRIESFNAGYRGGTMDELAKLVECDRVDSTAVKNDYNHQVKLLLKMGELDTAGYPCTE